MSSTPSRGPHHPRSCHERALGLLAVRARSRRELERRLLQAGFEADEVGDVLDRLERVGLVDDEAFARQVAEHAFRNKLAGRRAVTGKLAAAGVPPDLIASVVGGRGSGEEERALELAAGRAARMGSLEPAKAFQRLTSLLVRRGYDADLARRTARKALSVTSDPEDPSLASRFTRP